MTNGTQPPPPENLWSKPYGDLKSGASTGANANKKPDTSREPDSSTGSTTKPEPGQDTKSAYAGLERSKLISADPDIMSAFHLLNREIERDRAVLDGDMSVETLEKYRALLTGEMEQKRAVKEKIASKSGMTQAVDLIDRTLILEEDIVASKSKSSDKRRQTQRHVLQGIGYKKEAVDILKKYIGG